MLGISKRMTEYELGTALSLPHITGREMIAEFYAVLENVLMTHDRSTSMFKATEGLVDNLFVYGKPTLGVVCPCMLLSLREPGKKTSNIYMIS